MPFRRAGLVPAKAVHDHVDVHDHVHVAADTRVPRNNLSVRVFPQ
jgi:hypothetical protein